ncbi:MAG: enoyl-CoA hydratase/isomerase family protein [Burkholderiales bacterium]|nr:enoyl-CoA hydratase/isomerase family protein [Burkholderiales bacterium]
MNRPEVLNALHNEANYKVQDVWDEFAARDDLWAAILTGVGDRAFCAVNDLKAWREGDCHITPGNPHGY